MRRKLQVNLLKVNMSRYFVSVTPDAETNARIDEISKGISGATWVPSDQHHLTLKFIGSLGPERAAEFAAVLGEITQTPFPCLLEGVGTFPHIDGRGALNVLWLGIQESARLMRLDDTVEDHAVKIGLDPNDRPLKPHLTIARLRGTERSDVKRWMKKHHGLSLPPFTIKSFELMNSHFVDDGMEYEVVQSFPLK